MPFPPCSRVDTPGPDLHTRNLGHWVKGDRWNQSPTGPNRGPSPAHPSTHMLSGWASFTLSHTSDHPPPGSSDTEPASWTAGVLVPKRGRRLGSRWNWARVCSPGMQRGRGAVRGLALRAQVGGLVAGRIPVWAADGEHRLEPGAALGSGALDGRVGGDGQRVRPLVPAGER